MCGRDSSFLLSRWLSAETGTSSYPIQMALPGDIKIMTENCILNYCSRTSRTHHNIGSNITIGSQNAQ